VINHMYMSRSQLRRAAKVIEEADIFWMFVRKYYFRNFRRPIIVSHALSIKALLLTNQLEGLDQIREVAT